MTQPSPQSHNPVVDPNAADPRQDPAMRSLYRMSRTAGVGLQDYAAVNIFAVVGLILAAASVLVIIFDDVLPMLILPLAAVVVSVLAFWQIRRSNGTQTGSALAIAGVVIALTLAGTNIVKRSQEAGENSRHTQQLRSMTDTLGQQVIAGKMEEAYQHFDVRFREAVGLETFDRTLDFRVNKFFGEHKVQMLSLGDRVFINTDPNGVTTASALLLVKADGTFPDGSPLQAQEPIEFRLTDGEWKIHSIQNWFVITPANRGR